MKVKTKAQQYVQRAIKRFGITPDCGKAGYMLRDGRMLNFRERGHSAIGDILGKERGYDAMYTFMHETGAIRLAEQTSTELNVEIHQSLGKRQFKELSNNCALRVPTICYDFYTDVGDEEMPKTDCGKPKEMLKVLQKLVNAP